MNTYDKLDEILMILTGAEFLLRKAAINPQEAMQMKDSFARSAADLREAIDALTES